MPFLDVPNALLYFEIHGEGPWLVFAHGAGGNHLSWWQQVPEFEARFRCLVFCHRGWGRSPSDGETSPSSFSSDLTALLDHLDVKAATLVGQSMGGWTVAGCAIANPDRIERVVLTGTLGGLTDDAMLARLIELHSNQPGFDPHRALAQDFPTREPALTFLYDEIAGLNPPPSPRFLVSLLQLRHDPAGLRMPVHFIHGDGDQLFPLELARAAHAKVAGSTFDVIPGAGHSSYFEKAAAFNQALAACLRF